MSGGGKIGRKKSKNMGYIYLFEQLYSIIIIVMKNGNMENKIEMVHSGGGRMGENKLSKVWCIITYFLN